MQLLLKKRQESVLDFVNNIDLINSFTSVTFFFCFYIKPMNQGKVFPVNITIIGNFTDLYTHWLALFLLRQMLFFVPNYQSTQNEFY